MKAWPLTALAFGLSTLVVFAAFTFMPAVTAAYAPGEAGLALSAFQRAETMADLHAIFGDPPAAGAVAAMNAINTLDLYAFIPAYTVFLIAGAAMLGGGLRVRVAWPAFAFALLGAAADVGETYQQLHVTANWSLAHERLPIAPWHWAKYALLALNGVAVAAICFMSAKKRWVLGVLALAPLPLVAAAWLGVTSPRLFSAAFALYWIALLVVAVMETVRARGASA